MGEVTYTNDDASQVSLSDAEMVGEDGYGFVLEDKQVEGETFSRFLTATAMSIQSAARAVAAAQSADQAKDVVAASISAAGEAAEVATQARDDILNDPGFQAVAADKTGPDHIAAVGAAIASVDTAAANIAGILAAPVAAQSAADDANRAEQAAAAAAGVRYATTVGGTVDAIELTHTVNPVTAYVAPLYTYFRAMADNGGPVTVALDGLAAKPLTMPSGDPLAASDITAGMVVPLLYVPALDGFVIAGGGSVTPEYGSNGYGYRTISTDYPGGGADGDIWIKVEAQTTTVTIKNSDGKRTVSTSDATGPANDGDIWLKVI